MVREVRDALIVAGGLGTRMLPASAAVAKEILPLVDIPALYHLVWEAVAAGCDRIHLILSPNKLGLAKTLKPSNEMVDKMRSARPDLPPSAFEPLPEGVEVFIAVQKTARGLGDAISCALDNVEGAFLVLLGDNLLMAKHPNAEDVGVSNASLASTRLVASFQRTGRPCAGIKQVAEKDVSNYGVVALSGEKIVNLVEKPSIEDAPSRWVLCGRYLFTPDTAELLTEYDLASHGEMQTIAIQRYWMAQDGGLIGVDLDDHQWYDSGSPLSWLIAQIDHALRRDDLADGLRAWFDGRL
jgi:UTP--glucose-1-phosphate uridylyltransferase